MGTGTSGSAAEIIPAELANACGRLAVARNTDTIAGRRARFVAEPDSTLEAAALLRAASDLGLTVVIRGAGSRQHWGASPTSCDLIVDTRMLHRIIEHAGGDLVVRAQAGVRVDYLGRVLESAGQRLALDSARAGESASAANGAGTVGGLVATGAAGPLRYRYGGPRDLLIGITIVRADGTVAKAGGKVVKNVAGYDLGKLFAGSFGTLGLITEATFRLHPKPEAATWITVESADPQGAAEIVRVMADAPLAPSAIELNWPSAVDSIAVSVLLEGDRASVDGRADRMTSVLTRATVGEVTRGTVGLPPGQPKRPGGSSTHPTLAADVGDQTAPAQRPSDHPRDEAHAGVEPVAGPFRVGRVSVDDRGRPHRTTVRVAFWVGQLATVLGIIRGSAAEYGLDPAISGSAGAGVLDVTLNHGAPADAVGGFVSTLRAGLAGLSAAGGVVPSVASAVVVCAPDLVRDSVDLWGPVPSLRLMQAVKDQFDPEHRMAPGRFAGGT